MPKPKRAVLYLRVSTDDQTIENQRQALTEAARQRGWQIIGEYADEGISGAKGRDQRPRFDAMLKDAARGKFDVLMAWSVDRLGRSLLDLISALQELHSAGVNLFLHQQAVDTTTPAGRAMFQMLGVFAEFERAMIQARVVAGIARAKQQGTKSGKPFGRPKIDAKTEGKIRQSLRERGILATAKHVGVGTSVVQRIAAEVR